MGASCGCQTSSVDEKAHISAPRYQSNGYTTNGRVPPRMPVGRQERYDKPPSVDPRISEEERERRRQLALQAAENREKENEKRGGLSEKKRRELKERQRQEDEMKRKGMWAERDQNIMRMLD
ncbi:unnamed protein product [Vitrella brassicaformis CCMP3155]|uniref:Uncharacterized protein n=1 Tax=Vitrella brassicaformis (strain CCMP3155) TaxID=1169540 RepID=A0A0G4EXB9_VITBC|nr:unnamed protein product [Vitrella brassicaformis CCMP3155]|mmetsp:Transcript_28960/g.72185  ORF Transcript_28960/g.72185 Transcript_28960/m.72185 type:complete len:122 (-) Transcript_28960:31-396(-)|eukprot:CEM03214.1 unnamed protein product [Vitrella brassicaformis CCMP3155]